jgi:hypothetical protein
MAQKLGPNLDNMTNARGVIGGCGVQVAIASLSPFNLIILAEHRRLEPRSDVLQHFRLAVGLDLGGPEHPPFDKMVLTQGLGYEAQGRQVT